MVAMLGKVRCVCTYGMECMGGVQEPQSKLGESV